MVVFLAAGGGGNQAQFTTSAFDSGTVVTAAMAATTAPSDRLSEGVALKAFTSSVCCYSSSPCF